MQRQPFKHEVIGAYKYTIKETEAKEWITRSGMAPKSACEKTGLMTAQNMRKYAWRELCRKIECDAMGDTTFKPLPIVDGLYDMKQDTKNETKQQTNKQITGDSRTSVEPIGQLEIDGDFY